MNAKFPSGYHWIRLKLLKNSRKRHQGYILFITFVVYALYHASRKPLSVVKTIFHQSCAHLDGKNDNWCQWRPFDTADWSRLVGLLEYSFLLCYSIAMFPCGHLAERIDLRIFLSVGMALSGLTTIMFGLCYYLDLHSFSFYLIIQILGGAVQATGWPAVVTILSNWFGKSRRGLILGVWNANTNVGNVIGSLLAGAFVNYSWGASFILPGLLMLFAAYCLLFLLVDQPYPNLQLSSSSNGLQSYGRNSESISQSESPKISKSASALSADYYMDIKAFSESRDRPISFCAALRLPNVLLYSFTLFFSKLVSYTFLYWLPNFLANATTQKVSAEWAAALSTIFDIGGVFGGILAGLLSDDGSSDLSSSASESSKRTIYFRSVTCAGMLALAAPTLFIYLTWAMAGSSVAHYLLFICGLLVTGPCALITTAVSADLGSQPGLHSNAKALATVTAIIDGTGSLGAALGPFLTGILLPLGWFAVFSMLIIAELLAFGIVVVIAFQNRQRSPGKVLRLGTLNL